MVSFIIMVWQEETVVKKTEEEIKENGCDLIKRSIYLQKGENVMLDFTLSDGKRMTLEDCGDCLNAKLWTEGGEYMGEINWDIDSIADMLFTE